MTNSMVGILVKKDLLLYRRPIMVYLGLSLVATGIVGLLVGRVPTWVLINLGFTLLVFPMGVCGMHVLMHTTVHEKLKSVQPFILSLPVTVREFTWAKVLVNVPVFTLLWLIMSAGCLWFAFGVGLFPRGMLPFVTMILVGIYLAYVCILSVSLLFQALGPSIFSAMFFQVGTAVYLIAIAHTVDAVGLHLTAPAAVWNGTAIGIIAGQVLLSILVLWVAVALQLRKRDFV